MTNIILIHGAYGNPEENWFPWIRNKFKKINYPVICPKFPTPENQTLKNRNNVFDKYISEINEDSILIGHSLGPSFLLNILEKLDKPVKACFFVSGFIRLLGNSDFDPINQTFVDRNFNWEKINSNCKNFFIYHSDNDPYVPIEEAHNLAKYLNADIIEIKDAGHFNESAGYTKFPLLLENIESFLN